MQRSCYYIRVCDKWCLRVPYSRPALHFARGSSEIHCDQGQNLHQSSFSRLTMISQKAQWASSYSVRLVVVAGGWIWSLTSAASVREESPECGCQRCLCWACDAVTHTISWVKLEVYVEQLMFGSRMAGCTPRRPVILVSYPMSMGYSEFFNRGTGQWWSTGCCIW